MTDDTRSRGGWPGRFRSYLWLLAKMHLDERLRREMDLSDVVQQTLLQVHGTMEGFRGRTDAEVAAWLRQALSRNLAQVVRDFGRDKRNINRDRFLEEAIDASLARLEAWRAAEQSSPSQQTQLNETLLQLCEAVDELPESHREAVQLRCLHDCKLSEIAEPMDRTPASVERLMRESRHLLSELM